GSAPRASSATKQNSTAPQATRRLARVRFIGRESWLRSDTRLDVRQRRGAGGGGRRNAPADSPAPGGLEAHHARNNKRGREAKSESVRDSATPPTLRACVGSSRHLRRLGLVPAIRISQRLSLLAALFGHMLKCKYSVAGSFDLLV